MIFATESAPATGGGFILYLTAAATLAALAYLTFAMLRPEKF